VPIRGADLEKQTASVQCVRLLLIMRVFIGAIIWCKSALLFREAGQPTPCTATSHTSAHQAHFVPRFAAKLNNTGHLIYIQAVGMFLKLFSRATR
jgi:hypothetical protein